MFPKSFRNLRKLSINGAVVESIIENLDGLDIFVDYINDPAVVAEIMSFRAARVNDPATHARNCVLFSMLSPQTRFDFNVQAFRNLIAMWDTAPDHATITAAIRMVSFAPTKAARILEAWDFLNDPVLHERMSKKNLRALNGMGEKTVSFALALFDDMQPVFTMDIHMLRAICYATGFGHDVNALITNSAYTKLESAIVEYLQKKGVSSPFVAQWSLWNAWGFNRHVSHLPIIEEA